MATTRAIRRYTDDPIPEDDLAEILWHATRAPSGSNRQPFRFLALRDGAAAVEAKALLGTSFREMWSAKQAADGYAAGSGADTSSPSFTTSTFTASTSTLTYLRITSSSSRCSRGR